MKHSPFLYPRNVLYGRVGELVDRDNECRKNAREALHFAWANNKSRNSITRKIQSYWLHQSHEAVIEAIEEFNK